MSQSSLPEPLTAFAELRPIVERLAAQQIRRRSVPDPLLDADDLAQEIWLRLLSRREGVPVFENETAACVYLQKVAGSVATSHHRARQSRCRGGHEPLSLFSDSVADPSANPERRADSRQRVRLVTEAIRRATPPASRRRNLVILRMHWGQGLRYQEIADETGGRLERAAISSIVFRARQVASRAVAKDAPARPISRHDRLHARSLASRNARASGSARLP